MLTDQEIEMISKQFMSSVGDHWSSEDAIREKDIDDFVSAIITAHEAKQQAVPRSVPAQEVIDAIEAWKSAWSKVPPFGNKVNKATREAITFSHNTLFQLLWTAQQAQRMPAACPTPTGCGPNGCHGACLPATDGGVVEYKPVGYLRSHEFDGHEWEPVDDEWPLGELLYAARAKGQS